MIPRICVQYRNGNPWPFYFVWFIRLFGWKCALPQGSDSQTRREITNVLTEKILKMSIEGAELKLERRLSHRPFFFFLFVFPLNSGVDVDKVHPSEFEEKELWTSTTESKSQETKTRKQKCSIELTRPSTTLFTCHNNQCANITSHLQTDQRSPIWKGKKDKMPCTTSNTAAEESTV
jgi:hypothetical protein